VKLRVRALLETPAAISLRRATGNELDTNRYIPGSVFRGALAAAFLRGGGTADAAEFKKVFLDKPVRFGDLRIGGASPWPLSARACQENYEHPVIDLLLRRDARLLRECQENDLSSGLRCGAKMELPNGFYLDSRKDNQIEPRYQKEPVKTRRLAHSEIDPRYLKVRPRQFHSSQVIEANQYFEGFVQADEERCDLLRRMIEDTSKNHPAYIGRGRSRGQGRIRLEVVSEEALGLDEMTEAVRRFSEVAEANGWQDKVVFSCTLLSPTIVLDRWLMPRYSLQAGDIGNSLGGYECQPAFNRTVEVSGWHAAAGLPKPETTAIAAGSVLLFVAEAGGDKREEYSRLARILLAAEGNGIGERTEEGFGEVAFCDKFHIRLAGVQ